MKRLKQTIALLMLAAGTLLTSGCRHSPGGIAASTTPINGRSYTELGPTAATDSYILFLGFIPLKGSNYTRSAIDAAKARIGADALIDVTVDSYFQFWIFFTRGAIEVRGTGIRFD